ncbi:MAG TPA: hypothetical protein VNP98_13015 [Chthoniobacterales bacterium]|nr:hypothetical protein [Chthoniobacterales bacterium]
MKIILIIIAALAAPSSMLAQSAFASPCGAPRSIKRITNTHIGKYEYVEFEVRRPPNPQYSVTTVTPPFTHDGSGDTITVAGNKFKQIRFTGVMWACKINETFSLPKTAIKGIKSTGQFEGVVTYVIGYRTASTYLNTYHYDVGSIRKVVMRFKR